MAQTKRAPTRRRKGTRPGSHASRSAIRGAAERSAARPQPWLIGLAAVLALGVGFASAFRGLYFTPQQMWALILAAVAAWCVVLGRTFAAVSFPRRPTDWAVLALLAAYLLSTFVAVHPDGAVQALLLRALYAAVFVAVAEVALASALAARIVLLGLLLGGAVAAATGLLAAAGVPLSGAFVGGRIYTLIQYPDAAAAYLAAVMFVALGLRARTSGLPARLALGALAATLLFTFVFALSRGATIVFVPVAVLFVVALGPGAWVDGLASLAIAAIAAGLGALPFALGLRRAAAAAAALAARTHQTAAAALGPPGVRPVVEALLAVWAAALVLEFAWSRLRGRSFGRWRWAAAAGAVVVVAGGVAAVAVVLGRRGHGVLSRLGHLSLSGYNAWSRLRWMRDALRMVGRRPLLGWGGGGWAAAYQAFQSYNYSSTQVHNGWLQVMVSTGAVGLACWIALWVAVGVATVAAYRRARPGERPVIVGLAAAAAMIGGHGLIDFTLSLGAISLALWTVFALLRSAGAAPAAATPAPARGVPQAKLPPGRSAARPPRSATASIAPAAVLCATAAAAVFAVLQLASAHHLTVGAQDGASGSLAAAALQFQGSIADDPWSADAYADLGEVEWNLGSHATQQALLTQYFGEAQADFTKALALDPYNFTIRQDYAGYLQARGQDTAALAQLQQALRDAPYVQAVYSNVAVGIMRAAVPAIEAGKTAEAKGLLAEIQPLAAQLQARSAAVPGPALAAVKSGQNAAFPPTAPGVQLALGESDAVQGQWAPASAALQPLAAQPGQLGAEASLWLGAVEQRQGDLAASGQALGLAQAGLGTSYNGELQAVNAIIGKLAAG